MLKCKSKKQRSAEDFRFAASLIWSFALLNPFLHCNWNNIWHLFLLPLSLAGRDLRCGCHFAFWPISAGVSYNFQALNRPNNPYHHRGGGTVLFWFSFLNQYLRSMGCNNYLLLVAVIDSRWHPCVIFWNWANSLQFVHTWGVNMVKNQLIQYRNWRKSRN